MVEIIKDHIRAECPGCHAHVYRYGDAHALCECGSRHNTEQSIIICRAYRTFSRAVLDPWEPAGTREDNDWSRIVQWNPIRARVLTRDDRTCTWPGCCMRSDLGEEIKVHHIIPREAGGSNDPRNLRVLCAEHHEATHKLIGDGFSALPGVKLALRRDKLPAEERAQVLAGTHPIVTEAREILAIRRDPNPRRRAMRMDLHNGTQRIFEVVP